MALQMTLDQWQFCEPGFQSGLTMQNSREQAGYMPFKDVKEQLIAETLSSQTLSTSVNHLAVPEALRRARDDHMNNSTNKSYVIKEDKLEIRICDDGSPDKLGHGGGGSVFSGRYDSAEVALKIVRLRDSTVRGLERALKEVKNLQTHSAYVLRMFGYTICLEGNQSFVCVVTELLESDLRRAISEKRDLLTSKRRLTVMQHVTCGLRHLHELDIIHGDVKPANIFIEHNGKHGLKAKIGDLGLAYQQSEAMCAGFTPNYASPEQKRGGQCSTKTDIYSTGLVFYEIWTGRLARGDKTPMLQATAGIPEAICALIAECTSEDPDSRPSADDILSTINKLAKLVAMQEGRREHTVHKTPVEANDIPDPFAPKHCEKTAGANTVAGATTAVGPLTAGQLQQALSTYSTKPVLRVRGMDIQRLVLHLTNSFATYNFIVVSRGGSENVMGTAVSDITFSGVEGWPTASARRWPLARSQTSYKLYALAQGHLRYDTRYCDVFYTPVEPRDVVRRWSNEIVTFHHRGRL